jgi:hypothetical protein
MNFSITDAGGSIGPFCWANAIMHMQDVQEHEKWRSRCLSCRKTYLSFDGWFGFAWKGRLFRIGGRHTYAP